MRKFLLILAFALAGCGYQPTARITQNLIQSPVFVDVAMSKTDPQNTVLIKDHVRAGVIERLHERIGERASAKTIIKVSILRARFSTLSYDSSGYAGSYRADVTLRFEMHTADGKTLARNTTGDHEFTISNESDSDSSKVKVSSIISDKDRLNAIEEASKQAFDEFVSYLAIVGMRGR